MSQQKIILIDTVHGQKHILGVGGWSVKKLFLDWCCDRWSL